MAEQGKVIDLGLNFGGTPTGERKYILQLQVDIGKYLRTKDEDEQGLTISFAGREVTIQPRNGGKLSETRSLVFKADGFTSEKAANTFGAQLQTAVRLAGLPSRLGTEIKGELAVRGYDPGVATLIAWPGRISVEVIKHIRP